MKFWSIYFLLCNIELEFSIKKKISTIKSNKKEGHFNINKNSSSLYSIQLKLFDLRYCNMRDLRTNLRRRNMEIYFFIASGVLQC